MDQADAGKYKINYAEWVFDDVNPVYAARAYRLIKAEGLIEPAEDSIYRIVSNSIAIQNNYSDNRLYI